MFDHFGVFLEGLSGFDQARPGLLGYVMLKTVDVIAISIGSTEKI